MRAHTHPPPDWVVLASLLRQKQKLRDTNLERSEQEYRGREKRQDKDLERPRGCF